jgi:hypothetical protein
MLGKFVLHGVMLVSGSGWLGVGVCQDEALKASA